MQAMSEDTDRQASTLGLALLAYMVGVVLVITWMPFRFYLPAKITIWGYGTVWDLVVNIVLFVPIGFLHKINLGGKQDRWCLRTLALGLSLSVCVEVVQIFLVSRYSTFTDVLANGLGAWLGATVIAAFRKRIDEALPKLFVFEIPLINIVYMLIPVIWANGLAIGRDPYRQVLILPAGLAGLVILSGIYRNHFREEFGTTRAKWVVFTIGWFVIASSPALVRQPGSTLAIIMIIGCVALGLVSRPFEILPETRRFEVPVLKKVFPFYLVYLLLMAMWPLRFDLPGWQAVWGLPYESHDGGSITLFRVIEYFAAFTLFGYILAEFRGRKREPLGHTLAWIALPTVILSTALETARGFIPGLHASVTEWIVVNVVALYGAGLYRLQLSAIEKRRRRG